MPAVAPFVFEPFELDPTRRRLTSSGEPVAVSARHLDVTLCTFPANLPTGAKPHGLVIVAHGVVCKVLFLSVLPGLSVGDWHRLGPIHNVALTELEGDDGRWQARRLNELPRGVSEPGK